MNAPSAHALPAVALDPEDIGTVRNLAEALPPDVNLERGLFDELGDSNPVTAERLRRAMHQLPVVGDWFAGFELMAVLGRGAFGRVYLARQGDLADRYVALKVSTDLAGESRTLARLQHTNIVPIYSVHRVAPFQAVCMPYFGATTLGHLLARYRGLRSLPASGRQLVDTLCGLNDQTDAPSSITGGSARSASGSQRGIGTGGNSDRGDPSSVEAGTLPPRSGTQGFLGTLRKMSYSEAVCWIGARLAEGLAHAHSQGLIHNDLKPANVLLTDEGRPMLLDFGVAEDLAVRASAPLARIGGTLPFMAPEHLASIETGTPATDSRSDIYGLGILLFEMLTGQHPFRLPTGKTEEEVPVMLAERRAGPPRLRTLNRTVTPGLEAIVRKCLEPDPARRYQSAADVSEDLDRHRTDQPLRHVRVPSILERISKWSRRHPRLTSNLTMGIAAFVIIGLCAAGLWARGERIERFEATDASRGLDDDLKAVRYRLSARPSEPQAVGASIDRCAAALARYGLPGDAAWDQRPTFRVLPAEEQLRVRDRLTEACLLLARGYALRARSEGEADLLARATELNALAERISSQDVPRAVWEQRAGLLRRLGKPEEAERLATRAKETPLQTGRDYYLSGAESFAAGRLQAARELFAKSVELNPADFWAHTSLGATFEALGNYTAAAPCFDTAIALQPDVSWGYFNRGLLALRMRDFEKSRKDLDRAVALDPDHAETYFQRAIADQWLRDYDAALKDLDRAVEAGGAKMRATYMRVRVRELSGDKAAAKRELEEALRQEPTDELTWQARGAARVNIDLAGSLADFDAAIALNPRSLAALQNRSHILSRLGRHEEAARALDKVLDLYPDYVSAWPDRGVMRARLGNWDGAKADAEEALRRDQSPRNLYQVGAIYALLTKHDPANKTEAIRLVAAALRAGFGYEHVETDEDLAPLHDTPEFQRIVDGVRSIIASAKQ